ncbi:hypothetical protein [Rhizobium leguminosarum]|uniref:hypothetical protein n=1 Tax=Rhizobium leguminosarum TaxID=384 RepID=UPI00046CFA19|nr:hypothetical protein [Rhizobium leguminosarum]
MIKLFNSFSSSLTSIRLLLALSAHLAAADYAGAPPAVVGLAALAVSFLTRNAARAKGSPYALPRA